MAALSAAVTYTENFSMCPLTTGTPKVTVKREKEVTWYKVYKVGDFLLGVQMFVLDPESDCRLSAPQRSRLMSPPMNKSS